MACGIAGGPPADAEVAVAWGVAVAVVAAAAVAAAVGAAVAAAAVATVAAAGRVAVGAAVAAAGSCTVGLWHCVHMSILKLAWFSGNGLTLPGAWHVKQSVR